MFYSFLRYIIASLIWLINGHAQTQNKQQLPEGPFVLVAPHRTWLDPVFLALASWPHHFSFMAKSELFKNPLMRWLLVKVGAFPVDRAHPGPSAIKVPVRALKDEHKALMIFPTGSRYSADMKGGAILIAKLAKAPIVPAVYQGPGSFWSLFKRKPAIVRFGAPVEPPKGKLTDEALAAFSDKLQKNFNALDYAINPEYKYVPDKKKYLEEKEHGEV